MSDPFADIDKEVNIEKIKSFFKKYKFLIFLFSLVIIIIPSLIFYINEHTEKKNIRISGYFVEILAVLQQDENKAIEELEKLSKLDHKGFKILSDLILVKVSLKNKNFNEAKAKLKKIEDALEVKNKDILKKVVALYSAQASLELNDKSNLDEKISELLSYGDNWALLAHEIRGHFLYNNKDFENAKKDFIKILNEQQSGNAIRARAQEMLQNIHMYDETNS